MENSRLLEIENETKTLLQVIADAAIRLEMLGKERCLILAVSIRRTGPILEFDPDGQTIRWNGGAVKLGRKSYCFVKTLWFAKKRLMKTIKLCQKVFGNSLIPSETLRKFIHRLAKQLESVKFPYKIEPKKGGPKFEIQGYRMRGTS